MAKVIYKKEIGVNMLGELEYTVLPTCPVCGEWTEKTKNNCLLDVISCSPTKIKEWLYGEGNENEKTFIYAWLDGYEIEQEKLYTVKVLDSTLFKMTSDNHVRYKLIGENAIPLESKIGNYTFEVDLTEKEIKEADERLWQFAKEVENDTEN